MEFNFSDNHYVTVSSAYIYSPSVPGLACFFFQVRPVVLYSVTLQVENSAGSY